MQDGRLTQKQADAIKAARERSGRVLGPLGGRGRGPHGGPGLRGHGLRHGLLDELASALGSTPEKLLEQLRDGKTPAEIARANGRSLAEVRRAVTSAIERRLTEAVADGDLTRRQADAIIERVERRLRRIESGRLPRLGDHRGRDNRPALRPGVGPAELAPPAAVQS